MDEILAEGASFKPPCSISSKRKDINDKVSKGGAPKSKSGRRASKTSTSEGSACPATSVDIVDIVGDSPAVHSDKPENPTPAHVGSCTLASALIIGSFGPILSGHRKPPRGNPTASSLRTKRTARIDDLLTGDGTPLDPPENARHPLLLHFEFPLPPGSNAKHFFRPDFSFLEGDCLICPDIVKKWVANALPPSEVGYAQALSLSETRETLLQSAVSEIVINYSAYLHLRRADEILGSDEGATQIKLGEWRRSTPSSSKKIVRWNAF